MGAPKRGPDVVGLGADDECALEAPCLSWGPRFALGFTAARVGLRYCFRRSGEPVDLLAPDFVKMPRELINFE